MQTLLRSGAVLGLMLAASSCGYSIRGEFKVTDPNLQGITLHTEDGDKLLVDGIYTLKVKSDSMKIENFRGKEFAEIEFSDNVKDIDPRYFNLRARDIG